MKEVKAFKTKLRKLAKKEFNRLKELCQHSKNLYNQALYTLNEEYRASGKYLGYVDLDKIMQKKTNLEGKVNYRFLKAHVSQQILRRLDKNYSSFFKLIKKYKANKKSFKGVPRPPKYIKRKVYNLIYSNISFQIKNNKIILERESNLMFDVPSPIQNKKINQIEIIPKSSFFEVIFIYEDDKTYVKIKSNNNTMAIDLGLNNLATCVTNKVIQPFIINGKPLKSINQYYNKKASKIKSSLMKRQARHWSKRLDTLNSNRERKITDYLHKASAKIEKKCVENQISKVIIGNVANSNYKINLGKKTNQNFVNISLGQFIEKLKYKLERHNITVIIREESYTSKASFIDNDVIPLKYEQNKKYTFSGKRVKRGLYLSKNDIKINADVNGAYNLLRKETPKFCYNGVEGWLIPHKLVI